MEIMKRRVLAAFLAMMLTCGVAFSGNAVYAAEVTETTAESDAAVEETAAQTTDAEAEAKPEGSTEQPETTEAAEAAVTEATETEETEATEAAESKPVTEMSAAEDVAAVKVTENMKYAASGKCGDNLTWSYNNGVLTISGSGAMYDYPVYDTPGSSQCMPWYACKSSITAVNIAEGVTSIGACAFWGCSSLASVTTPSTISTIGFGAFTDCTRLQQATIKSGFVGESAFIRCTALNTVTVGSGVTGFGISAFENCTGLTGVYISDLAAWCRIDFGGYLANPLQFAKHLYLNGSEVTNLQIPDGVTAISDYAFEYGKSITSVTIPSSVTTIGDYAFYLCDGIRTVNLPAGGLTRIGASAFDSCSGLTSIAIPNSVSYIGTFAFAWAPIESANIYQGVIEGHAFEGCGCISNVTIGSGVTYIGDNAFNRCAGLRTVQYGGSRAQWRALEIGANNEALTGASVTCSGSGSASTDGVDRTKIHVGGTVKYGSYEQDNNTSNGAETIEWTVLDIQGDKALVISKNVLDFQRYYPNLQTTVTWANSSIRTWLNDSFYNAAFSDGQKSGIYTTSVSGESNTVFGTSGGSATSDKIFLLSASEAASYLNTDGKRMANCTEYALSRNGDSALRNTTTQSSYWWLRTPGIYTYDAMYVHYTGSLRYDGMAVANVIGGVRPAMWVNKNVVEVVPESNRVITEDPIEQFVTRLYQVCLNREPDDAGLNDWVNRLSSGQASGVEVSYGFVFSQEFQNYNYCNTDYVKQLYRAFMGREYDQGGLDDWVGRLGTGTTREEVFNGFSQSEEFNNLCTQYGITRGDGIAVPQYGTVPRGACTVCGATDGVTAFVTRLYNICLDRNPDTDGLNDWTNGLWDHTKSGGSVAQGFIFSQEFKNKNLNDNDYVEYLYRAFFDRSADAGGKADWVSRMQTQGYSREDVFNGFVGSEEFNNLCKKYGITRD